MGRERQKKKNRSSITKSRPKANKRTKTGRRKVDFGNNEIIARNWDRNLTLSQNYKRLGLSNRLASATGGTERRGKENEQSKKFDSLAIPAARKIGKIAPEEVSVERDPETGRILRVLRPETSNEPVYNPLNDKLLEIDEASEPHAEPTTTGVVAELEQEAEEEAERLAKKRPRQQSQREEEWIARLLEKHGDNFKAMSRDKKLNPMQQTEGDIGRRVRRWKESKAGG